MPNIQTALSILCELIRLPQVVPASSDTLVQMAVLLADKLEGACTPIDTGRTGGENTDTSKIVPAEDLDRDARVLDRLRWVLPSGGGAGVKRSLWAQACAAEGIGRRAFDTSRVRLLLSGQVRQVGKRYVLANTDAP